MLMEKLEAKASHGKADSSFAGFKGKEFTYLARNFSTIQVNAGAKVHTTKRRW